MNHGYAVPKLLNKLRTALSATYLLVLFVGVSEGSSKLGNAQVMSNEPSLTASFCDTLLDEAEKLLSKGMYERGISLEKRSAHFLAAAEKYRKAIQCNPTNRAAYTGFADLLREVGEYDSAHEKIREAIKIDPTYSENYRVMGKILREQGKLKDSETALRKALLIDQKNAKNYASLAFTLYEMDNTSKEAESLYRKALELTKDGNNKQARYDAIVSIAFIHLKRGNYEDAKQGFIEGMKFNDDIPDAYTGMAMLKIEMKDKTAIDDINKAMERFPGSDFYMSILKTARELISEK
ncbi:MAG: hypothetical protein HZA17_01835 [Nitrospirae bacterium]|nr:hypothetical protein [Nitrospirota bacterium]